MSVFRDRVDRVICLTGDRPQMISTLRFEIMFVIQRTAAVAICDGRHKPDLAKNGPGE